MKNIFVALLIALVLALSAAPLSAQGSYTLTTTTAALTPASNTVYVTTATVSATAFVAGNLFIIDHELFQINNTYVSGLIIPVTRGMYGTLQTSHASAALVFAGPPNYFPLNDRYGSCTASQSPVLPIFSINRTLRDVLIYNCNNGQWVPQILPGDIPGTSGPYEYCTIPLNGLLGNGVTSLASYGTSTAIVSGTIFYSSVDVPRTMYVTGLKVINGATASTDLMIYSLYRADGTLVANTAVAGVTSAGANAFQNAAFTTPYVATGPARYWIGVSGNGTTATLRLLATNTTEGVLASSRTGTFATLASIVAPPALITVTGPIGCLY